LGRGSVRPAPKLGKIAAIWYKDKEMKKLVWLLVPLFLPLVLAGQDRVEKIEIVGNDRVTRETILYYLTSREGDYFNEDSLRKDFRVLWSTGFFSNLKIEGEEGLGGKVVKITVEENPVIKTITYKTGKKVKEDDIVNKLKEKDEYVLPYSYYSSAKVQKVKETIVDLLLEKGLYAAKVDVQAEKKGKNEVDLLFKIDEGPKVRVGEVIFAGRPKIPQSELQMAMKSNRPHSLFSWVGGKDVYKENKLQEDLENIKAKFQENGYMEATVDVPSVEEMTKRTVFMKKQKMMKLVFPVNAGYRYSVGDVAVEGSKAVSIDYLRSLIKLKKGEVYSTKIREKAVEDIGEAYRNVGYLYIQVMPIESLDPKNKRVNVTYNIYEGEVAYLHRLEFRGNNYTKDKVIRREMLLREGDRFSLALFKDSILRIKQLGLVDLEKEPDIKPSPDDPTKLDAVVSVKELQRNNIQFTAGYSGYEGFFVMASYSTVNFLGAGENLEISAQYGKRVKNYVFGFTEPYIFDLPITAGFNVYDRFLMYPYLYDRKGRGADLILGARLKGYWRGNLTYSYELVDIRPSTYSGGYYPGYGTGYPGYGTGYPGYYPGFGYGYGKYTVSAVIPTIYRSTIDSPLTPSRGTMILASLKYAGGPLGGEVDFIKPKLEFTYWHPTLSKQVFGVHAVYQFIQPAGGSMVPFWERFYLGGERDIRGYDIYSIGPRDPKTGQLLGGMKALVFNAEYQLHLAEPLNLILFYDIGNAYLQPQKINFHNMYSSTGIEARIFVPALRVPFRLILAYNNRLVYPGDTNLNFRFAIGTTF
jgi:outer membrane protein insertion porin family